ncbi:uncharacterized protein LOC117103263, partial [Anneissia japonica]|uniref:uncharacterized protein LOC117103263 n=1 Tax=Anneissia japonica TaxID=1529436 RepID=UPI00142595AA
ITDEEAPTTSNCPTVDLEIIPGSAIDVSVNWDEPSFVDNSGDTPSVTKTHNPGELFNIGETIVVYNATDAYFNEGYCEINITVVQDTEAPVFTSCPSDTIVDTLENKNYSIVNFTVPVAIDNIQLLSVEQALTNYNPDGDIYYIGTTTIRYLALDEVNQPTYCTFSITVEDNQMPNITCPSNINVTTDPMSDMANVTWNDAVAIDNNDGVLAVYGSESPPSLFPIGQSEVTYNATDSNNNTAECSFDINVSDEEAPVFTYCPPDIAVGNDPGANNATVTWDEPSVTDNSLMDVMLESDIMNGSVFQLGNTTVMYTAIDMYGNINENCSFVVTVSDTEPPMTDECLENITITTDAGESFASNIIWTAPGFTDNSMMTPNVVSSHDSTDSSLEYPIGTTIITYNATDDAGNLGQCEFPIIVTDIEAPVFTECPGDIMDNTDVGSATATITWGAVDATDNSGLMVTIESNFQNGTGFPIGETLVMYNATDSSGNINDTCLFWVNITDVEAPVFTECPNDIMENTDAGSATATITWSAVEATDNSGLMVTIQSNFQNGTGFPIGGTLVMYNATDSSGNINDTCTFWVNITDMEPPEFTSCPSNITLDTDPGSPERIVEWENVTAEDNSQLPVLIDGTHESGDSFPIGTTPVMFNATDEAGNVNTTCEFDVTINDNEPPVFTECPSEDIVQGTDDGNPSAVVIWPDVNATDNSGIPPVILSNYDSGDTFPIGSTFVKFNATDAAGNVNNTCQFFVNITDEEAPVFTFCPSDNTSTTDPGVNSTSMTWMAAEADDNSGETPMYTRSHESGDIFVFGSTIVQINASDAAGNVNFTCSFIITITDDEMPTTDDCPADQNVTTDEGMSFATSVSWILPTFEDNVDKTVELVISESQASNISTMFFIGATEITINATDLSMNTGTCTFNIYVTDEEAPVFTMCPDDQSINTTVGEPTGMTTWETPTATDNSGDTPDIVGTHNTSYDFPAGDTTVEYTATDAYGNVNTSCTFVISVEDNEAPIITFCPPDEDIFTDIQTNTGAANWQNPTAIDNSGVPPNITTNIQIDELLVIGNHTVFVNATDGSGNINTTCFFNVEIIDNVPPVVSCINNTIIMLGNDSSTAIVNWTAPDVFDNSGESVTLTSAPSSSGDEFGIGTFVITYTAVDIYGNEDQSCMFTVTVTDQEAPNITCPSNITEETEPGSRAALINWIVPVPTDNVALTALSPVAVPNRTPVVTIFITKDDFQTYTATDTAGNSASCTFYITVEDKEPPVIEDCPMDINLNTSASVNYTDVTWTEPTAMDNSGSTPTLTSTHSVGSNFYIGETIVTYTAVDGFDNTATCNFTISVQDIEPPTFDCQESFNVNTTMNSNSTNVTWSYPTYMDNSYRDVSVMESHPIPTVLVIGIHEITYTFTDIYNNTDSCSFNITVNDFEDPEVTFCPDNVHNNTEPGLNYANITWMMPTAEDNSGFFTTQQTAMSGDGFGIGTDTVTYTFTDANLNMNECTFIVNVTDIENPEITCPADVTVGADSGALDTSVTWNSPSASDNDDVEVQIVSDVNYVNGSTFQIGTTTVTYQATDPSGNTNLCSFNVTVEDMEDPDISYCPANITLPTDEGAGDRVVYWTEPTATDNSGNVSITRSHTNGSTFDLGDTTVMYNFSDPSGNTATCEFTVTIIDIEPPTPSPCPNNETYSTDLGVNYKEDVTWSGVSFSDNAPSDMALETSSSGITSGSNMFLLGTTEVTYSATDEAMNTGYCTFFITIIDTELPTVMCPDDISTNSTEGAATAIVSYTATAMDNVEVTMESFDMPSGSAFDFGDTNVTFMAFDAAGNEGNCTFTVTVEDFEPPEFTNCPDNITETTDERVNYTMVSWSPVTAEDNSLVEPNIESSHNSNDSFYIGTVEVVFTATDNAGNEATCSFFVTVEDDEEPVIEGCPSDITQMSDMGSNTRSVNWTAPTATDNSYDPPVVESSHSPEDIFEIGTTTVVYNFTDASDNQNQCTFDVTITDDEAPQFIDCPSDINAVTDNNLPTSFQMWDPPTATDNNGVPNVTESHTSPFDFAIMITNVTYVATDLSGNTAVCFFLVNITDQQNPNVTCPPLTEMNTTDGGNTAVVTWATPESSDNDDQVTGVTSSLMSGDTFNIGDTNVTVTATDTSGNTASCVFIVRIIDPEAPEIQDCPVNITVSADMDTNSTNVIWTPPTATDNDGTPDVNNNFSPSSRFEIGEYMVVYTFSDPSGNEATCTFIVTVTDDQDPETMNCPNDIMNSTDIMSNTTSGITWIPPTYIDNSGQPVIVTISGSTDPPATFPIGETNVTYTATDESGNTDVCSFLVTITDDESPIIITPCPDDISNSTEFYGSTPRVIWTPPTATDNSNSVTTTSTHMPNDTFPVGYGIVTTVTYTFTDPYDNEVSCSFDVTIQDLIPPVLHDLPSDFSVNTSVGVNYTVVSWPAPSSTDNSGVVYQASLVQPGTVLEIGTHEVCYVAVDPSNNAVRECFFVTVEDNERPVITNYEMEHLVVFTNPGTNTTVDWSIPVATDNSNEPVTVECNIESGSSFEIGNYTVTCTSTDPYNNTASIMFEIYVFATDIEPPVVTCPNSFEVTTDPGSPSASPVSWQPVTATDNYGVYNLTGTHANGSSFNLGPTPVTFIAFDISGLMGECNFTVTVIDEEIPDIITCPENITQNTDSGEAFATIAIGMPTYQDNSGSATLSMSPNTAMFNIGQTTVIFTVTDASGNSNSCELIVTVKDNEDPVIVHCPNDILEDNLAGQNFADVVWTTPNATDNDMIQDTYMSSTSGSRFTVGETNVNVMWVDNSGNSATCEFVVEVRDVESPVYTNCPTADVQQETSIGTNESAVFWTPPELSDNVGVVVNISDYEPGDVFQLGVTVVTYRAEDAAGNIKQCVFTVVVIDTENPVFSTCAILQPSITNSTLPGEAVGTVYWDIPTASDNDKVMRVIASHMPNDTFGFGSTSVLYTAYDDSGNTGTCSFQVIITDDENPILSNCPNDTTFSPMTGSNDVIAVWSDPVATDNVDTSLNVISSHTSNTTFSIGFYPVTYTVSDQSGNSATCSFLITIEDTTPPEITNCPSNITKSTDPGENFAIVDWNEPTVTDNAGTPIVTSTFNPMDSFQFLYGGQVPVIYQAFDLSGNTDSCLFYVTIMDNEDPVIASCPANQSLAASATAPTQFATWDNVDATDNVMIISQIASPLSGSTFDIGVTEVEISVSDFSFNTATCSFYVEVYDDTDPVYMSCPGPLSFSTDLGSPTATATWSSLVVTDNVGVVMPTNSHDSGVQLMPGVTTIYNNATDEAGNTAECIFEVTVTDDEDPEFAMCPNPFTRIASSTSTMTTVTWDISNATDNVGVIMDSSTHSSGDEFEVGTYVISYEASDAAGNTATCEFTLVIQDASAPTFENCSESMTLETGAGVDGTNVSWIHPTALDNSGNVVSTSMTPVIQSGSYFTIGIYNINFTAIDSAGNKGYCLFTIVIQDVEDPIITQCENDITTLPDNGTTNAVVSFTRPTATDNSNSVSETATHLPNAVFPPGLTTVTYTFSDLSGNQNMCSFTVNVQDDMAPVITNCPDSILNNTEIGEADREIGWIEPEITDNAGDPLVERSHIPGTRFSIGTTYVNYTATDSFGNQQVCSFVVTIIDDENPVISNCPSNEVAYTDEDETTAVVTWNLPTATDNSGQPGLSSTYPSGYAFPIGDSVVTYIATDSSTNTVQCTFTIHVTDNQPPDVINCPNNIDQTTDLRSPTAQVMWDEPTFVDNVDGNLTSTRTFQSGSDFIVGVFTNTYQATDTEGNSADCVFTITVTDEESPVFMNCPADFTETDSNIAYWSPPTAEDNTVLVTIMSEYSPGSAFPTGTTNVRYTAYDQYDNEEFCTFNVNIEGVGAPVIGTCPESITVIAEEGETTAQPTWDTPTADDDGTSLTPSCNVQSGDTLSIGSSTAVLCVFTSPSTGLESTCRFTVTVEAYPDEIDPEIQNCPVDQSVDTDIGSSSATVTWTPPTAIDNSNVNPTLTATIEPGTEFNIGTTTVQYIARDSSGNTAICSFMVTVIGIIDMVDPEITCPSDITEFVNDGTDTYSVSWTVPTPTDDSGTVSISSNLLPGASFTVGTTTQVTYTATDGSGNTAQCSFSVTVTGNEPYYVFVLDNEDPVFDSAPVSPVTASVYGQTSTTVSWTEPVVTDNSGEDPTITLTGGTNGGTFNVGTTSLIYTATDGSNNQATYSFDVVVTVVEDVEPPVFTNCPSGGVTGVNTPGENMGVASWDALMATDDLATDVTITPDLTSGSFPLGESAMIVSASDGVNTAVCNFTVTITDNEDPVSVSCPENQNFYVLDSNSVALIIWSDPMFTDNSGDLTLTSNVESGVRRGPGMLSVEYTASDPSGNDATCTFTVNIEVASDPASFDGEAVFVSIGGTSSSEFPNVDLAALQQDLDDLFRGSDIASSFVGLDSVMFDTQDGTKTDFTVYVTSGVTASDIENAFYNALDDSMTFSTMNTISAETFLIGLGDCSSSPCQNSGTCTRLLSSYTCTCASGYQGNNCQTDINECSDSSICSGGAICTNFAGGYNCDCEYGFSKVGSSDTCTRQLIFNGAFTLLEYDGDLATFEDDLNDLSSALYMYLTNKIIEALGPLFDGINGFLGVQIASLESGSIIVEYAVLFEIDSSADGPMLDTMFLQNVNGSGFIANSSLVLDLSSIQSFSEVCPDDYCKNGGTCTTSSVTFESECSCTDGWKGTTCEEKSGLETWEIVAICSASALILLIILIATAACCCCFLGGSRYNNHYMYDEEFHVRDRYNQPRKDRLYDNYYNENFHPEPSPRFNQDFDENIYDNRGSRFYQHGSPERHFSRPFIVSGDELSDPRYSPQL